MTTLTETQSSVLRAIITWYADPNRREFYLAGYAGTGKSTLLDVVINELRERCGVRTVRTGTYTGKAAHVLRKKGVAGAQTIHSMIYRLIEDEETGQPRFEIDPAGAAADADLIVLDECSMVPEVMADDLRSFGKKILVVGDPGQLPPVKGQGAFTNRRPDAFLTEIHRQAAESPIIQLATRARCGDPIPLGDYGDGVRVVGYNADAGRYVYDPQAQPIVGLNRVRWVLTQRVRSWLGFKAPLPQPGEPVLCCRNNKQNGIFNGQQGVLKAPLRDSLDGHGVKEIVAQMEDQARPISTQCHPYLFNAHFSGDPSPPKLPKSIKVDHFDWGYVLTCHKSQGSQWPRVTVVDDSQAFRDDRNRWLYTAITRAEAELTLIRRAA